ncbi:Hydrolase, alpha/beta fold protein family [Roseibacterium elongatum DSM 19469]|uniref:Hydrolase, alpha/beta fold protein family n=1 Tax=Roseicyclus elongatus DSM 19469 TaxID=1294273 RepID=W8S744_9RHOB|nr:alpha/beta hydrolase [Roseibacterium elongatum]AHM04766.1 Hydrolase, alpha/beta fold protein family [Roseibacterium elongatum DSM 19469]
MEFVTAEDGLRLAYDDQGGGTSLLCLPGLTRNMEDFEPVLDHYADRARVIRMDFRGRGASDHGDPATYSVPQEARDVLTLLDHLGIARAVILGTSRGGLVAMMLAATAKDRLAGVILNDIGPDVMPEGLSMIMQYIGKRPGVRTLEEAAAAFPVAYADSFQNVPAATWADFARRLYLQTDDGLALRYDPRLREAVAPAFEPDAVQPDLWPLFDAFDGLPLGLIRGAQSNILSSETTAEMRRRRPDMAFAELADRGHVPFLDEPGARAVIDTVLERAQ